MTKLDRYLDVATRDNTRRSYPSGVRYFEVEWGGQLPATATANSVGGTSRTTRANSR